jgi:hypothetical protein
MGWGGRLLTWPVILRKSIPGDTFFFGGTQTRKSRDWLQGFGTNEIHRTSPPNLSLALPSIGEVRLLVCRFLFIPNGYFIAGALQD